MNFLHLFIPHPKNNHRSKILHHSSLLILIIAFTFLSVLGAFVNKTNPQILGISYQISDQELLNLVNQEREERGLPSLALNPLLSGAAAKKANHMFQNNYWAHFAPDGTSPWVFINGENYKYVYAGENLAKGFTTSSEAVRAWMDSPSHRANILSEKYEDMGFAVVEGKLEKENTVLIVQMFGSTKNLSKESKSLNPNNKITQNGAVPKETLGSNYSFYNELNNAPIIDVIFSTKALVFLVLSALTFALVLDLIIVEKNKVPRVVGNNLDHILLITIFILFIVISKFGETI